MSTSDPGDDLRQRTDKILESLLDDEALRELFRANLAQTKGAQADIQCKECKKTRRYWVQIPDAKAVVAALDLLLNQAKGRPDVAKGESEERIVFERVVYMGDEQEPSV